MADLIKYHAATTDLALFKSDQRYWVGSYFPHALHQNGEPPYVIIDGYFDSEEEGLQVLETLSGAEF